MGCSPACPACPPPSHRGRTSRGPASDPQEALMNRATCVDPLCLRPAHALGLGILDPARPWVCAGHTRGTCRSTCQVVHPQSKLRPLWAQVWGRRALGTGWKGKPAPHHLPAPQKTLSQPGLPSTCTAPSGNEKMKGAYLPGPAGGAGRAGLMFTVFLSRFSWTLPLTFCPQQKSYHKEKCNLPAPHGLCRGLCGMVLGD